VSVVIPTWNEELWLPRLLDQLQCQSTVAEVIVADNASVDNTVRIANDYGCLVVDGGRPGVGRNRGAKSGRVSMFV
jgi:glycosyltransferase involved in cell wall biosynthesis